MLKEQLQSDLIIAMRAKNTLHTTLIRGLLAEIHNAEIAQGREKERDAALELTVLTREVGRYKEALDFAKQSERLDVIEKANTEYAFVSSYLPPQLTDAQVEEKIVSILAQGTPRNLGAVMKLLTPQVKGQFDMKVATNIVKRILEG